MRTIVLPLLVAACATAPAPAPQGEGTGVVAVSLRTTQPGDPRWGRPTEVWFVRLVEGADPARAGPVLASNYAVGGTVCLLDAAPGRYVAVAALEKFEGRDWTTYLSADLIRATEAELTAGGLAYLGSFETGTRPATAIPDEAQRHYEALVSPRWVASKEVLKIFTRYRYAYGRGYVRLDTESDDRARLEAHLRESGWFTR